MSPTPRDSAESAFAAAFRATPGTVGHAPGRVELLGNHTDYNGGLVLAAAINRFTAAVGRRVEGRMCRVVTNDLGSSDTFDIGTIERGPEGSWVNYVRGTVWAMNERFGPLASGFEMTLAGDVPIGAGLSSSASLQASVALFLIREGLVNIGGHVELFDSLRMEIARTLQRSENEFVGVGSGLLDQFSVLFGRADHALLLDCRSLEFERVPLGDPAPAIVVCDSKTSRKLADGMYNIRRAECERIVSHFQTLHPDREISQLRDLSLDELREEWDLLDTIGRLRARHVLTENERVHQGAEALERAYPEVLIHAPADHPVLDEVRLGSGRVTTAEEWEGTTCMYHIPDVGGFLTSILPELTKRAVASGMALPMELGFTVDDRRWLLHIDADGSRVEADKLSRRHLTLPSAAFVRLAMGHSGIDRAIAEDGGESSTATAIDAARILFPIRPIWRSPLDSATA